RSRTMRVALTISAIAGITGCVGDSPQSSFEEADVSCPQLLDQSMIETSSTVLTDARFGLKRVFNTIRTTTPQTIPTTVPASATAMFQSLYAFFNKGSGGAI